MPDGGTLTIVARNSRWMRASAVRHAVAAGDYVEIAVEDTGTGMPPETSGEGLRAVLHDQERRQRHRARSRPGLWLRAAVRAAPPGWRAGSARAPSVRLLLPRSRRELRGSRARRAGFGRPTAWRPAHPGGRGRDRRRRMPCWTCWRSLATAATCVATVGVGAGTCWPTRKQTDLVLSDVLLPGGGSGLDLAREMRHRQLDVPVILTSGYGGGDDAAPVHDEPAVPAQALPDRDVATGDRMRAAIAGRGSAIVRMPAASGIEPPARGSPPSDHRPADHPPVRHARADRRRADPAQRGRRPGHRQLAGHGRVHVRPRHRQPADPRHRDPGDGLHGAVADPGADEPRHHRRRRLACWPTRRLAPAPPRPPRPRPPPKGPTVPNN